MTPSPGARTLEIAILFPTLVVYLAAIALVLSTLLLAGQPIYANDTWIHLALGEVFLRDGPWLASDPHLFTAKGPPSPSSWLGSAALYSIYDLTGFTGLRIAHVLAVLVILLLAWRVMRKAGSLPVTAGAGVGLFVLLSTYRLVQLRPDLFTIAATLGLFLLLFTRQEGPSRGQIALAALLAAVWSNVHAAFVLGPALVLGASAAIGAASLLPGSIDTRAQERGRAGRLAVAGLGMAAASCLNPQGLDAHLAYFSSGQETAALEMIADEWNPTNLLRWPTPYLPPTIAAWLACWLCAVSTLFAVGIFVRDRVKTHGAHPRTVDPGLLALAGAGLVAAGVASRFLWLGLFALALLGALASRKTAASREGDGTVAARIVAGSTALVAVAAALLHAYAGDWPLLSRAMRTESADYAAPYPTERYNTHAIWFLSDTGVEGHIFNDYPLGGFMSFWLSPKLMMASSGTMNVSRDAMAANLAVGARQTLREGEDYAALLDRQGFDLFLGAGYPIEATPGRPIPCTIRHLANEPGWILVFRNLRSGVYLRRNAENAANLARIAAYYAKAGVPFDAERGFETEKTIRAAPEWSLEHGLVPIDFEALVAHVRAQRNPPHVDLQTHRLALLYATLGVYERALTVDRFIQKVEPRDSTSAWRVIWNLVQLGRWDDAMTAAQDFEARSQAAQSSGASPWSKLIEQLRAADPSARETLVAHLPVLRLEQVDWVRSGVALAPARRQRSRSAP